MLLPLAVLALLAPQASSSPSPGAAPARRPARGEASPRPAASDEPRAGETVAGDKVKDQTPREKEEPPVVTRHELRLGGRTLRYSVTTGMMPLKNEAGETEANIFYMAYVAERSGGPEKRPLTFSFNGGPGSSSVW